MRPGISRDEHLPQQHERLGKVKGALREAVPARAQQIDALLVDRNLRHGGRWCSVLDGVPLPRHAALWRRRVPTVNLVVVLNGSSSVSQLVQLMSLILAEPRTEPECANVPPNSPKLSSVDSQATEYKTYYANSRARHLQRLEFTHAFESVQAEVA